MGELSGKVAIVTGATRMRGLGRAIATTLARAGANVIVTGSDSQPPHLTANERSAGWRGLPDVVAELQTLGVRAHGVSLDVRNSEEVQALARTAVERMGRVDEVAELVRYLCGPNARWISGDVLLINGGEVRRAAH